MKKLLGPSEGLIRFIHNIGAILLAVSAILVFYQVITRFVLGDAAAWSEVLARAVIIWTVFLVLGPAIRLGRMIPIDAIRNLLPPTAQIWLIRFVTLATAVVLFVLIWYGYKMTLRVMHQQVAMINISVAWFYVARRSAHCWQSPVWFWRISTPRPSRNSSIFKLGHSLRDDG